MTHKDLLFVGFDHKKDPEIVMAANDDKYGVTVSFNKNLLVRFNHEFNANFDLGAY